MNRQPFKTNSRGTGFSFIELMVTLIFVLILGSLIAWFIMDVNSPSENNLRQAREDLMLLESALGAYIVDLEKSMPTKQEGGLEVLVVTGYLQSIPKDPWGNTYLYHNPGVYSGRSYDLYSYGPDGHASEDDVVIWNMYGSRLWFGSEKSKQGSVKQP